MLSFLCLLSVLLVAKSQVSVAQIYQFPAPPFTVVENIAVRSNGVLLLTTITPTANLWALDPQAATPTPSLVHTFPGFGSSTGITEVFPDVFALTTGNFTVATKTGILGTFAVWKVDLRLPGSPVITKVTDLPEGHTLNSVCYLAPWKILIADSTLGVVWRVDIITGAYEIVIDDPKLKNTPTFNLGVNGVEVFGTKLYFTNSAQGIFGSVRINSDGIPIGSLVTIATPYAPNPPFPGYPSNIYDDFAINKYGKAYVATHPNSVVSINTVGGTQTTVASGTTFIQPTSAALGRSSSEEECYLYVVSAGTFYNASYIESGQVIRVEVC